MRVRPKVNLVGKMLIINCVVAVETAGQQIVRELTEKYIKEIHQSLKKTEEEYS